MNNTTHSVQRIRHEAARLRLLTVIRVARITPRMVRVTLTGDLQGFASVAHDDHVKLFFPAPGGSEPILPKGPPGSPEAAEGPTPIARDYTPRRFDAAANELDIEFVLHSEGPATTWAEQAKPGDQLGVGGPRGSFVVSGEFAWHLLIADEAGLPAIARCLSELPASSKVFVVAEVEDVNEEQKFATHAQLQTTWLHRLGQAPGQVNALLNALTKEGLPTGDGYTWIACESNVARKLRSYLITERGFDKQWIKAAGYWKHGAAATHEKHED
jgi:NADPH-dependent ferric siderophore reductase